MGTESYTHLHAFRVLIVCLGVSVASYGDLNFDLEGITLQIGSLFADALRCILLQKTLQHKSISLSPMATLYYVAPASAVALIGPFAWFEARSLLQNLNSLPAAMPWVVLSGVLACALNVVVFELIGRTSALTTSLSGVLKEWVCILTAMYLHGVIVTGLQWGGYGLALAGLFWYQYEKIIKAAAKQPQLPCKVDATAASKPLVQVYAYRPTHRTA
eukprot:jgi/Chrzof1/4139/Cz14g00170.t1